MARFLLQGVKHKITGYNSWLNEFGAMNPKEHSTLNDKILDIRETEKIMKASPLTQFFLSHGELKVDCKWTNNKLIYSISNDIAMQLWDNLADIHFSIREKFIDIKTTLTWLYDT